MDEKTQQFVTDLAGLALLVLQAVFHGQVLFDSTPSGSQTFQATHGAIQQAKAGLAEMNSAAASS